MNMPANMMKIEVQISTMLSRSQHEIKQNNIYIKYTVLYFCNVSIKNFYLTSSLTTCCIAPAYFSLKRPSPPC